MRPAWEEYRWRPRHRRNRALLWPGVKLDADARIPIKSLQGDRQNLFLALIYSAALIYRANYFYGYLRGRRNRAGRIVQSSLDLGIILLPRRMKSAE